MTSPAGLCTCDVPCGNLAKVAQLWANQEYDLEWYVIEVTEEDSQIVVSKMLIYSGEGVYFCVYHKG